MSLLHLMLNTCVTAAMVPDSVDDGFLDILDHIDQRPYCVQ